MLPGFRFLFAAVALSISLLMFGLGAAALLRAAHVQFTDVHALHPPPIALLSQPAEAASPTLSMLRVEPAATETAVADVKAVDIAPERTAPDAQAAATTVAAVSVSAPATTPDAAQAARSEATIEAGPKPETATPAPAGPQPVAAAAKPEPPSPTAESDRHGSEPAATEPLLQTAALSGPIPTPRPDPRAPAKPVAPEPASAPADPVEPYAVVPPPEAPPKAAPAREASVNAATEETSQPVRRRHRVRNVEKRAKPIVHHRRARPAAPQPATTSPFGQPG
jgi:hypothetical protein